MLFAQAKGPDDLSCLFLSCFPV